MTENNILQQYFGKIIHSFEIAMIGGNYLEFIEGKCWLSDVGIQFNFDDGSLFSIFYDEQTDRFDLYERSLEDHLDGVEHYYVDLMGDCFPNTLQGVALSDIKMKEIEIQNQEYDGTVTASFYLPVEYTMLFENGCSLQIATVTVSIDAEQAAIKSIHYNPEGNIWISFDEIFEIEL